MDPLQLEMIHLPNLRKLYYWFAGTIILHNISDLSVCNRLRSSFNWFEQTPIRVTESFTEMWSFFYGRSSSGMVWIKYILVVCFDS